MASLKSELLQLAPEDVEKELFKKASVKRQYFATFCMDLLAFSYGASCGWPSASIPILKSDETPLETGPISTVEASWIASGICIGGFFGNLFIGWVNFHLDHHLKFFHNYSSQLSSRMGQKNSLCLSALPQILSWLFIYYAKTPFYLIVSRLLGGFAGGGFYSIAPTYISEISDDKIRGTLGSTVVFSCNLGLFVSYVCGEYFDYLTIPWLMIPGKTSKLQHNDIVFQNLSLFSGTLAFLVFFIKVPDSPPFLARKNLYDVTMSI